MELFAFVLLVLLVVAAVSALLLARTLRDVRRGVRGLARDGYVGIVPRSTLARDIHWDLRQIEHRQRELAQAAADEDFSLRAVLGSMVEGVLVANRDLTIRQTNERLLKMFALSRVPVGRTVMEVFRNHTLHQTVRRTVESGQPQFIELQFDVREDQQFVPRHFQVTSVSLRPPQQDLPSGILLILHDVTQLRTLEAVRREFVANVSHELRTPLSVISGYLETLLDTELDSETRSRFVATMHKHAQRLNLLLEDLLQLSRIESRGVRPDLKQLNVGSLIERVLDRLDSRIQKMQVTIELDVSESLPSIQGAPIQLEQAMFNLVDNALKYGARANLVIGIRAYRESRELIVQVSDNGPGIPLSDQPHIFERFYRVHKDRSRDAGGTGLGLSIVKHTIQAHGGTVSLESGPVTGCKFTVRLPIGPPFGAGSTSPGSHS